MTCYNCHDQVMDLVRLYHDMGWFRRQIIDWLKSDWGFTEYGAQEFVRRALNN